MVSNINGFLHGYRAKEHAFYILKVLTESFFMILFHHLGEFSIQVF